ncbi:MAG: aminotransferase class III-fold pyridoxal phosphate-dependent enzyme [Elusimicrobiota bacterium]
MAKSTEKSWKLYEESVNYLGAGSSTNSKSPRLKPEEPAVIVRGKGCRVWDADGNEYIDYRNGLGPVSLGYAVPEINQAIKDQLENGIVFGHPHVLEGEVAKMLTEVIPCAEKVRFLKTGGEAIAACIKISRNATKRSRVVQCGYNGWLNVLSIPVAGASVPAGIANTEPTRGVPLELGQLHTNLPWGNIEPWEKYFAEYGNTTAVAVVASSYLDMDKGKEFLPAVRALTQKYGTLLVIDEIVTGFRVAQGGAHEYFNIMPDLAVFAKGCANGMPISVYCGKKELIDSASTISISSTFGGESLSLAAVKAVLKFYKDNNVITHLWEKGKNLWDGVNEVFKRNSFPVEVKGYPVCPQFVFIEKNVDTNFYRACYKHGVSLYGVSYINYSHKDKDIAETVERIEAAVKEIK